MSYANSALALLPSAPVAGFFLPRQSVLSAVARTISSGRSPAGALRVSAAARMHVRLPLATTRTWPAAQRFLAASAGAATTIVKAAAQNKAGASRRTRPLDPKRLAD